MSRVEAFKLTDDDWYSNYRLAKSSNALKQRERLVKVILSPLGPTGEHTRVSVWGNDDMGMERDFDNRSDASACFMSVLAQEVVNKDWLTGIGFLHA